MSGSLNKVILVGNLGRDPEVRQMQNNDRVANLSIATSERWKDRDGMMQDRTEWHRVVLFGKVAEIAERYLKKGSKVLVEGKLQTRKWTDQQGQDKYSTEVIVSGFGGQLTMLDSRDGGNTNSGDAGYGDPDYSQSNNTKSPAASSAPASSGGFGNSDLDDDIPF